MMGDALCDVFCLLHLHQQRAQQNDNDSLARRRRRHRLRRCLVSTTFNLTLKSNHDSLE